MASSSMTRQVKSLASTIRSAHAALLHARMLSRSEPCEQSVNPLKGRNFLTLKDYSAEEVKDLLWSSMDLKQRLHQEKQLEFLRGQNVALIFEKRSTRTRISMEGALSCLGGHPIFLSPNDIHLGVNETVKDTARVLSHLVECIFARVFKHTMLDEMAKEASVPVINGLSDAEHPLQCLADFLTLVERFKSINGMTLTWVGDGNNVLHSLMVAAPKLGVHMKIANPKGYDVWPEVRDHALLLAKQHGTLMEFTNDPVYACKDTNVIATDTWISMGQEEEYKKRVKDFAGYQVTMKMAREAASDWCFLHCLPRKPHEVDDEVFYSKRSLVWQEAGNRKWTSIAVLARLLSEYKPSAPHQIR